jgi:Fe2+ or Zn2+ uptake regulation protein
VNSAIQNSHMLTQFNIRKFIDFEDHSNEVDDEKNSSKDGYGLENAYVDAYGAF